MRHEHHPSDGREPDRQRTTRRTVMAVGSLLAIVHSGLPGRTRELVAP